MRRKWYGLYSLGAGRGRSGQANSFSRCTLSSQTCPTAADFTGNLTDTGSLESVALPAPNYDVAFASICHGLQADHAFSARCVMWDCLSVRTRGTGVPARAGRAGSYWKPYTAFGCHPNLPRHRGVVHALYKVSGAIWTGAHHPDCAGSAVAGLHVPR